MKQLPLEVRPRLSYTPENFILHEGIYSSYESCLRELKGSESAVVYFYGPSRSGKTHFSIFLSYTLAERGFYPRIVNGADFDPLIEATRKEEDEITILDDADQFLSRIPPGMSGPFVSYVEALRRRKGKLVLLSATPFVKLACDEHVKSRVVSGTGLEILPPGESDFPILVQQLSAQRGIKLSRKKVSFLVPRLRRSVASIEEYLESVVKLASVTGSRIGFPLLGDAIPPIDE